MCYTQGVTKILNSGIPRANPPSGRKESLNPTSGWSRAGPHDPRGSLAAKILKGLGSTLTFQLTSQVASDYLDVTSQKHFFY